MRQSLIAGALALAAATPLAAQSGAFVVVLGRDTIAVEQYARAGNRVEGDLVTRQPTTVITHYIVTLKPDGMPQSMEVTQTRADGSAIPNRPKSVHVVYAADTVTTMLHFADSVSTRKAAIAQAMPFFLNSFAMYEVAFGALRGAKQDSAVVAFTSPGAPRANTWPVALEDKDKARVWYFGAPQLVRLDASGRVLGVDATGTTNKFVATRVPRLDVKALASTFATVEQAGRGLGNQASPRDTARATIGAAAFIVDYGRPSARGRDVWKNGVLGDTLWRTGANQATHIVVPVAITIAGRDVPAGTYTLFTHVKKDREQYELIFNRQTGQWGTVYDRAQDLVRVPLTVSKTAAPVERFTIEIVPEGRGGAIRLSWADQALSVPFTVK